MGTPYQHQQVSIDGVAVQVTLRSGAMERHDFTSAAEAQDRAAIITEALSWIGTPFRDCADVKGPKGCVDCAMLLCRTFVDTGMVAAFDPRPYSPRQMLHSDKQTFLEHIARLGGVEVEKPRLGDVIVWQFGRSFSHGGVLVNDAEVMHAYAADGMATVTGRDAALLLHIAPNLKRPVIYFDCWRPAWER